MLGYFARTEAPDLTSENNSYQAQFDYAADRYGLQVDHLLVEDHFVPEVGFLRRDNFRRTYVQGRYSPRPQGLESVRQFRLQGSVDYILTADTTLLETRQSQLQVSTEFETSDQRLLEGYSLPRGHSRRHWQRFQSRDGRSGVSGGRSAPGAPDGP